MANYMAEVARLLGVEIGEEFECNDGTRCVFTSGGSFIVKHRVSNNDASNHILADLLMGVLTIKSKPWRPKYGEDYYCIGEYGQVIKNRCENCWMDIMYYKVGNCYRTKDQAIVNIHKWESFYESDEVLEV